MLKSARTTVFAALSVFCATLTAVTAWAGEAPHIVVRDAYLAISRPNPPSAAAFMVLTNEGETADRLVGASTELAKRVELHTHIAGDDGVMRMREVEGGFEIPSAGMHMLERGADHVMMMGLTGPVGEGDEVEITLIFEIAGEIIVTLPVRMAGSVKHSGHGDHSN